MSLKTGFLIILVAMSIMFMESNISNFVDKLVPVKVSKIEKSTVDIPNSDFETVAIDNIVKAEEVVIPETKKLKIITLEENNTVVLRSAVTEDSVTKAMADFQKKSYKLAKNDEIFFVLDTPGGSVFAGLDLIDFYTALPQKVNSVVLFAASMGFQITQNTDTRYITRTGMLMSHRASGGVSGQFEGELETRYMMIKRNIDYLDQIAANRMEMPVKAYKALIKDEYWVSGFDSIKDKAADEIILIKCGDSMKGSTKETIRTIFGPVTLEFHKCPLLKAPISVFFGETVKEEHKAELDSIIKLMINDKKEFTTKYITTNKFDSIFDVK